ncbi:hypothetical protein [Paraburkholderia sp. BL25I1N1]|uniref:hypothetical protein n=1 Tax=Paraburkholderia sp. BL25I1N1 TaxID=1938804 RepID=UPI0011B2222C|nr:hypothetical protein [Paraburkholderia sp. BL25I1N1]
MKPACRNQCIVNTVFSLVSMRPGVSHTLPSLPHGEALEYSLIDTLEFDWRPGQPDAAPRYF